MKKIISLGALALGVALAGSASTQAAVVAVGVAAPADECVKYRAHHPHRVVKYEYCDAPVYSGDPIVIEGVTYHDNLHYRMHEGHREFWVKGRWVVHD